jgi:hypothetical protein
MGEIDISKVDKIGINSELRKYKHPNGTPNYGEVFKIPKSQRIAELAKQNIAETIQVITVGITLALESMNLSRPMTAFQILDLAEAIVDEAESDNLAIEDVMLFLQQLTRGKYQLYEGMDIPKFMGMFNQYRDERWNEGIRIRDEKVLEYKQLGDQERTCQPNPLADHMTDFAGRIGDLKEKLREKSDQVKYLRGD